MTDEGKSPLVRAGDVPPNERARKILFDTYWSPVGWKQHRHVSTADRTYAIEAGYMFPRETVTHTQVVERIRAVHARITPAQVGNAFIASLSSRRLDLRSALGSYAVAMHFPLHRFEPPSSGRQCAICRMHGLEKDVDYDVLSFERHKWGGVRHLSPMYMAFDLEQFASVPNIGVRTEDVEMFRGILATISSLAPPARPNQLVKALAGVFPSNTAERQVAVSLLGYAGILATPAHASFLHSFVPFDQRQLPPVSRTDWDYPLWYWRAQYGIDQGALAFFFSDLNVAALG